MIGFQLQKNFVFLARPRSVPTLIRSVRTDYVVSSRAGSQPAAARLKSGLDGDVFHRLANILHLHLHLLQVQFLIFLLLVASYLGCTTQRKTSARPQGITYLASNLLYFTEYSVFPENLCFACDLRIASHITLVCVRSILRR